MRIGILQREDTSSIRTHSGVYYFMAKALGRHVGEVVHLGPDNTLLTRGLENVGRGLNKLTYALVRRRLSHDHNRFFSKRLAHIFRRRVEESKCDVIFAPNASAELAFLPSKVPIVYRTDLNWVNIVDYYRNCSSMFEFAKAEAERVEALAISKASALLYPSEWAAKSAIAHYGVDPRKVHCIPLGANFEHRDIPARDQATRHSLEGCLRLLWVGVDWNRKGGPIAHECLLELLNRGVEARLVVCGCVPPPRYRHPNIETVPFLSKRDPADRQKLSQMFLDANFFLFPTMAEGFGIVLCEASAHGLPSLVRNTGGVSGAIVNGQNGYLLPPNANGKEYASRILALINDVEEYGQLVRKTRRLYEERLNWDAWGRAVKPIFDNVTRASLEGQLNSRAKAALAASNAAY